MFVKDDICYASNPVKEIKVLSVKPLKGRLMLVLFNTGETKLYDTNQLSGSVFKKLDEESVFMNPVIFHGVITWNNGDIDIAPETVYADSVGYMDSIPSEK